MPAEYQAVMEVMVQDVGWSPLDAIHHGTGLAAEDLARTAVVFKGGRIVAVDRSASTPRHNIEADADEHHHRDG